INRFGGSQLHIKASLYNTIVGNYLGTDYTGRIALTHRGYGILIDEKAQLNTIGGTTPEERNVIAGDQFFRPVRITGVLSAFNTVEGNYLGVDVTGTKRLATSAESVVQIDGGSGGNHIGGTTAGAGNVIGGGLRGVVISDGIGNTVQANFIGTDASGTLDFGSTTGTGVSISGDATLNRVGGTTPGSGNLIAHWGFGVSIGFVSASATK